MLAFLKGILQSVLIWLLLLINGGQLPAELIPDIDIPDFSNVDFSGLNIDWSSLLAQAQTPVAVSPGSLLPAPDYELPSEQSAILRRVRSSNPSSMAAQDASTAALAGSTLGSSAGYAPDVGGLTGAIPYGAQSSEPIVNPSGAPRELVSASGAAWRSRSSSRRPSQNVETEFVDATSGDPWSTLGLIGLGAGALAVAGYVVVRRRRR